MRNNRIFRMVVLQHVVLSMLFGIAWWCCYSRTTTFIVVVVSATKQPLTNKVVQGGMKNRIIIPTIVRKDKDSDISTDSSRRPTILSSITKVWQMHLRPLASNAALPVVIAQQNRRQQNDPISRHHSSTKLTTNTTNAAPSEIHTSSETTISSSTIAKIDMPNQFMNNSSRQNRINNSGGNNYLKYNSIGFIQRYVVVLLVAVTRTTVRILQTISKDWYTGYYLRTTFERVERQYHKRYDIPSCLRSIGRLLVHGYVLFGLGRIMEEMVGLTNSPCSYRSGGCHWWCGLLWIIAVTGPGHAIGVSVAIWVQGLRLQMTDETTLHQNRPSLRHILSRPGRIIRYIVDPDQWFREILAARINDASSDPVRMALQPFTPDWRMFPATWSSLRILQMIAVAKEMYGSNYIMHTFMRQVLFQQAFCDEWYRVLMCEKRVAWGIVLMIGYTISTLGLFWNMIHKPAHIVSSLSILMTAPSVLAVIVSFWMNILVYFERRQTTYLRSGNKSTGINSNNGNVDTVQNTIQQYQRANLLPPTSQRSVHS